MGRSPIDGSALSVSRLVVAVRVADPVRAFAAQSLDQYAAAKALFHGYRLAAGGVDHIEPESRASE